MYHLERGGANSEKYLSIQFTSNIYFIYLNKSKSKSSIALYQRRKANNLDNSISSINNTGRSACSNDHVICKSYSKSRSRNESRLRNKTVKEALFSDFEGKSLGAWERFHYDSSPNKSKRLFLQQRLQHYFNL
jgi:hypothetical protein